MYASQDYTYDPNEYGYSPALIIYVYPEEFNIETYTIPCIPGSTMYLLSRFAIDTMESINIYPNNKWFSYKGAITIPNSRNTNGTMVVIPDGVTSIPILNANKQFPRTEFTTTTGKPVTVPMYAWTFMIRVQVKK